MSVFNISVISFNHKKPAFAKKHVVKALRFEFSTWKRSYMDNERCGYKALTEAATGGVL